MRTHTVSMRISMRKSQDQYTENDEGLAHCPFCQGSLYGFLWICQGSLIDFQALCKGSLLHCMHFARFPYCDLSRDPYGFPGICSGSLWIPRDMNTPDGDSPVVLGILETCRKSNGCRIPRLSLWILKVFQRISLEPLGVETDFPMDFIGIHTVGIPKGFPRDFIGNPRLFKGFSKRFHWNP